MLITNQEEWEVTKKWIDYGEEIITCVSKNIGDKIISPHEEEVIIDSLFRKGFKHYKAIVLLCTEGYGQDALIITRVLLELFYNIKYTLAPTKKKEIRKRAEQFFISEIYDKKKTIENIKRDVNAIEVPDELMDKIESEIKKHGKPDDWTKTCYELAKDIDEIKSYRQEYSYFSVFIHSKPLCLHQYNIDFAHKLAVNSSPSDLGTYISIGFATKYFLFILEEWQKQFGKIKKWEMNKIIKKFQQDNLNEQSHKN